MLVSSTREPYLTKVQDDAAEQAVSKPCFLAKEVRSWPLVRCGLDSLTAYSCPPSHHVVRAEAIARRYSQYHRSIGERPGNLVS